MQFPVRGNYDNANNIAKENDVRLKNACIIWDSNQLFVNAMSRQFVIPGVNDSSYVDLGTQMKIYFL